MTLGQNLGAAGGLRRTKTRAHDRQGGRRGALFDAGEAGEASEAPHHLASASLSLVLDGLQGKPAAIPAAKRAGGPEPRLGARD